MRLVNFLVKPVVKPGAFTGFSRLPTLKDAMYTIRKADPTLLPHEQGTAVKHCETYTEAHKWVESQESPEAFYISETSGRDCDFRDIEVNEVFFYPVDYPDNRINYELKKISARKAEILDEKRLGQKVFIPLDAWCEAVHA